MSNNMRVKNLLLTAVTLFITSVTVGQKKMQTGYINFPKNKSEVEINKAIEKKYVNLYPMYGYAQKSPDLINDDNKFINNALEICKCSKQEASKLVSDLGWSYFKQGNSEIANKRFNQAYLLDSTNYLIYWGFGVVMGRQNRNDESVFLFKKAISYKQNKSDTAYARLCMDVCKPLAGIYNENKQKDYLNEALGYMKIVSSILPTSPDVYFQYSHLYFDIADYQKAFYAYQKTISFDSTMANNNFLKQITDSLKVK